MNLKVQELLDLSLSTIKSSLEKKFPGQFSKYNDVLRELIRVRHDESDIKKYQYFQDIYWLVKRVADFPRDEVEWHDAIGVIGFLLDESDPVYKTIESDSSLEAEEVYNSLLGVIESIE